MIILRQKNIEAIRVEVIEEELGEK